MCQPVKVGVGKAVVKYFKTVERTGDIVICGWKRKSLLKVSKYMKNCEIEIYVEFGSKRNEVSVWTCDLTHKYIDINGCYRS